MGRKLYQVFSSRTFPPFTSVERSPFLIRIRRFLGDASCILNGLLDGSAVAQQVHKLKFTEGRASTDYSHALVISRELYALSSRFIYNGGSVCG